MNSGLSPPWSPQNVGRSRIEQGGHRADDEKSGDNSRFGREHPLWEIAPNDDLCRGIDDVKRNPVDCEREKDYGGNRCDDY